MLVPDLPIQLKTQGSNFVPPPIPSLAATSLDRFAAFLFEITHIEFPKLLNAGFECSWYFLGMKRVATGGRLNHGSTEALIRMWFWIAPGSGSELQSSIGGLVTLLLAPILLLLLYASI